jgi:hypothetical protein
MLSSNLSKWQRRRRRRKRRRYRNNLYIYLVYHIYKNNKKS